MRGFGATEDDLIFLRLSLGMHAEEADVLHLNPEMVEAYKGTRYAQV
jgi:hypothetical protein